MTSEDCYRVEWRPGTDELLGVCHCGATTITQDPIEMWQWLLAHPDGHLDAPGHDDRNSRLVQTIGAVS